MKTDLKLLSKIAQFSNSIGAYKIEVTEFRYYLSVNSSSNEDKLEEVRKQVYKFFLNSFDVVPTSFIDLQKGYEILLGKGMEVTIYHIKGL